MVLKVQEIETRSYEIGDLTVYVQKTLEGEFEVTAIKGRKVLHISEEEEERAVERAIQMAKQDIWMGVINEEEE
jgi:hypothetical protein